MYFETMHRNHFYMCASIHIFGDLNIFNVKATKAIIQHVHKNLHLTTWISPFIFIFRK